MKNHFTFSQGAYQKSKALCPWENSSESDFFADVDGTRKAFDEYVEFADQQVHRSNGSFHLAFGPGGCGKSSLLHRCADYFKSVNKEESTIIVDVSNDVHAAIPVDQKGEEALQIILEELQSPALTPNQIAKIREADSLSLKVRRLSKELTQNNSSLAIILPQIELVKEFEPYFSLMKNGISLFAETTSSEIEEHCRHAYGSQSNTPVQVMKLSPLTVVDGRVFIANRLSKRTDTCPDISEIIIDKVMEKRVEGGAGTSIRELHIVCEAVYQTVLDEGRASANYEDFADHYMKCGVVR